MIDAAMHIVIPDTQVRPGVNTAHLRWIGQYIAEHAGGHPDVKIIHLGDHWDMKSLSSYDKGKKSHEGLRYSADIKAGNAGLAELDEPILEFNKGLRRKWRPRKILLRGNHEDRITRAIEQDAELDGALSLDDLESPGWETHDFLKPVEVDGIHYSHFFYNPMTGRPYAGQSIDTRLKTIGHSFSMGHQQTLAYGLRFVAGRSQHGLVAGACYLHDEEYKGPQGNAHWRGVVVCHQVERGSYDPMFVSLDYLCRKYEGVRLNRFLVRHYA